MNYKVGDKVRVRYVLEVEKIYGGEIFVENMIPYLGKETVVRSIYDVKDNILYELEECGGWLWTSEMLEPAEENKSYIDISPLASTQPTIEYLQRSCKHQIVPMVVGNYTIAYCSICGKIFDIKTLPGEAGRASYE